MARGGNEEIRTGNHLRLFEAPQVDVTSSPRSLLPLYDVVVRNLMCFKQLRIILQEKRRRNTDVSNIY